VLSTLLSAAGLQVSIVVASLVSLPFVARNLSTDEFGVLTTLTGLIAVLAFADLGIGSALTTRVAHLRGLADHESARVAVSTAVVAAMVASLLVGCALMASVWLLPWERVLGAEHTSKSILHAAVGCTAVATALSVPASLGQRVLFGVQRGAVANGWLVIGSVAAAVASIVAAAADAPLYAYVLASIGVPVLTGLCCTVWTVAVFEPELRPRLALSSRVEWRTLRGETGWYFVIAFAGAVGFQTDALMVSGLIGASAAGIYNIASRLFGLVLQTVYSGLMQLWPAFADAYVREDYAWIRSRLVWASVLSGLGSGLVGVVLVVAGDDLVRVWLTDELVPPTQLLVALAVWTSYSLASAPLFLLLNAIGRVRAHGLAAAAVALANLPLSYVFTNAIGISGPAWGSVVASVACSAVPGIWIVNRIFRGFSDGGQFEPNGVPPGRQSASES
jgi:O-antigen/teichoic acid export membrane protein